MRSGQSFFVNSIFVRIFLRNSEKNSFFEKGNFEKNRKKKNDERPFLKIRKQKFRK